MSASILDAIADPNLFGPFFRGDSWEAWRALLAALFGLPMTADQLAAYQAHTGRSAPPDRPFSEGVLCVGRRGGKSRVLATIATFLATTKDYRPYLAPGEVATVAVLAANRAQARSIFRFVSGLLNGVPLLKAMIADETGEVIALTNNVVIEISTASFRTTRGYSFAAVLADEIAFWRQDETSANPDTEILRALRPGMASIPGSILLLASSPYAKRGELYTAYRKHYGKDDARVLVWKAPTAAMNPRIDPAIIAEAYEADPEAARAEYGAEFRDDLADFVTREVVDAVTCWGRRDLPPEPGVTYSAFCDPSGGASDSMTLAIGHLRDGSVCTLDAVLEVRAPFDPEVAVADCATLLRRFGVSRVVGDRYAGAWPAARFREHGIAFEQSARPKSDLYGDLLPLLSARRVELLDVPRLSAQLVALERRTARSGRDSIDHAPGGHDDIANAVAGVLVGLDLDRRPGLVRHADMLADGKPLPLPERCNALFAVLAANPSGAAATVYFAIGMAERLTLVDFDEGMLTGAVFANIRTRLAELHTECKPWRGVLGLFADPVLCRQIEGHGLHVEEIPEELLDPARLGLIAAAHVAGGHVKIAGADDPARTSRLTEALGLRPGDLATDPLRAAALYGVAIALNGVSVG